MELQKCIVQGLKLKVMHNWGFRPGETAEVIGVVMVTPEGKAPRLCYAARYSDGFVDYKPCDGAGDWYELTPNA